MRGSLRIHGDGIPVDVVNVVAFLVVAWVFGGAGAGEQAGGGDTEIEEAQVVGRGPERPVIELVVTLLKQTRNQHLPFLRWLVSCLEVVKQLLGANFLSLVDDV